MGLPCVAVTSLIIPFGQVPSSTSTVAPFLMSNGSFLVTIWALQVPLTAANKINAAGLIMCVFMSKVHDVPVRRIRPSQIQKASKFNGGRPARNAGSGALRKPRFLVTIAAGCDYQLNLSRSACSVIHKDPCVGH